MSLAPRWYSNIFVDSCLVGRGVSRETKVQVKKKKVEIRRNFLRKALLGRKFQGLTRYDRVSIHSIEFHTWPKFTPETTAIVDGPRTDVRIPYPAQMKGQANEMLPRLIGTSECVTDAEQAKKKSHSPRRNSTQGHTNDATFAPFVRHFMCTL